MINELSLNVLGNSKTGPIDAFNFYPGEDRTISLQVIDLETEQGVPIFNGDFKSGTITAFADAGGGLVTVTSAAHGLANGQGINITGTTNYNGFYTIANVAANTFTIVKAFVANDATGTWVVGPANMLLTFPGTAADVTIAIAFSDFDTEDRSIFNKNITKAQTATMIDGFIRFEFDDNAGRHRVAYLPHAIERLQSSGN